MFYLKNKTKLNKFNNNYHNIREMIYLHGIGINKFYLKRKSERFLNFFFEKLNLVSLKSIENFIDFNLEY